MAARTAEAAAAPNTGLEVATFAGGCFWSMVAPYEKLEGVAAVIAKGTEGEQKSLRISKAQPGTFFNASFDRFVDTWTALWDERADPWVNALGAGGLYVALCSLFSLLAFLGLLLARRADAAKTFPLSAAILFFPVTYYLTHSAVRYRHPI